MSKQAKSQEELAFDAETEVIMRCVKAIESMRDGEARTRIAEYLQSRYGDDALRNSMNVLEASLRETQCDCDDCVDERGGIGGIERMVQALKDRP